MAKRRPNGDGTIRKRTDGRWEGRVIIGHKDDKTPLMKTFTSKTQKALLDKMHRAIDEYDGVDLSEESDIQLGEWCDKWLNDYAEATLRPNTVRGYRSMIDHHIKPYLGDKQLRFLKTAEIQRLYQMLKVSGRKTLDKKHGNGLADSNVRKIHSLLHEILDAAVKSRLIPSNPCKGTAVPKCNYPPKRILTEDELNRFMEAIQKEPLWYDFFYTEITTGLRRGEICGLKWDDLNFETGKLSVKRSINSVRGKDVSVGETKTEKGKRDILLPPSTLHLLKEKAENAVSPWIFPSFFDQRLPVAPNSAYQRLKDILKEADLPDIRFHDLRHTFATHALVSGVDAKTLSGILGHTRASFTIDTYTHVTSDMHMKASEIVGNFVTDLFGGE